MRQVPHIPSYLLVGGGKMARHLSHYFDRIAVPHSIWSRQNQSEKQLNDHLAQNNTVLLLISDDQIQSFYEKYYRQGHQYVHFSGAIEHPEIWGFHPLMSFGDELYSLSTYEKVHFVGSHNEQDFHNFFPQLKNSYFQISKENKALYHSLCVLSGNGTTLLWDLVEIHFKNLGIPNQALEVYLEQISKNIIEHKEGRQSGPWYRNDTATIEKNKEALKNLPLLNLYNEFEKLTEKLGNSNEKRA